MKKFFFVAAALFASVLAASAQDLGAATETAKAANEALVAGNYDEALKGFQEALTLAEACGDEGVELVGTCKGIIPKIMLTVGKDLLGESKFDEAVAQFTKTIETATAMEAADVAEDATNFIVDTYKRKANALVKEGNNDGAIEALQKVVEFQPDNLQSYLLLGDQLMKSGKSAEAVATFTSVIEKAGDDEKNADELETAKKKISTVYLKDCQGLLKAGKFKEAMVAAQKSNEYVESANAYKLAASAASKIKDNKSAIEAYEKYLELSPDAKDANGIICTLAVLYQQGGNKEKAIEYYTKILNDEKYGATAKQQIEALKK